MVSSIEVRLGTAFLEQSSYSSKLSLFRRTYQQFTSFPLRYVSATTLQNYVKEVIAAIVAILGLRVIHGRMPSNVTVDIVGPFAFSWGSLFADKIHDLVMHFPMLLYECFPWLETDTDILENMLASQINATLSVSQISLLLVSATALSIISNTNVTDRAIVSKDVVPFLFHSHHPDEIPRVGLHFLLLCLFAF
jgi:nicotinamide riboside transporter PnuC